MIWIASFPRSGNTFVRNILHEVYGLESSEYHQEEDYHLDANYVSYPFVKTHLLPSQLDPSDPDIKAVYIVRDGRDTMVSIAHQRSDIVAPAVIENGQLRAETSGGTSMSCVLEHIALTRPASAIVVTDGYIEEVDQCLIQGISKTRFHAIVTRDGNPSALHRAGITYTQLDEVPS